MTPEQRAELIFDGHWTWKYDPKWSKNKTIEWIAEHIREGEKQARCDALEEVIEKMNKMSSDAYKGGEWAKAKASQEIAKEIRALKEA